MSSNIVFSVFNIYIYIYKQLHKKQSISISLDYKTVCISYALLSLEHFSSTFLLFQEKPLNYFNNYFDFFMGLHNCTVQLLYKTASIDSKILVQFCNKSCACFDLNDLYCVILFISYFDHNNHQFYISMTK